MRKQRTEEVKEGLSSSAIVDLGLKFKRKENKQLQNRRNDLP